MKFRKPLHRNLDRIVRIILPRQQGLPHTGRRGSPVPRSGSSGIGIWICTFSTTYNAEIQGWIRHHGIEGLQVDWPMIIADSLESTIASLVDGKKAWCGLAQLLTLLVSLVCAIRPMKRGRPETTPNKSSKQQQLPAKHTPGWIVGDSSRREEGQTTQRQELVEKAPEVTTKPIKIKLSR